MPTERRITNPEIVGLDRIQGDALPLGASQSFKKGAICKVSSGQMVEASNGDKLNLLLAAEDAAPGAHIWPTTKTKVNYLSLKGARVAINAYTASTNTPAIGTKYAIIKVGGVWRLNVDDTSTNPCATVVGLFDDSFALTDANVRVVVVFDEGACFAGEAQ